MEHYFGAHTIDNGGIHMAARRAGNAEMRALQIFTAIPKYYGDKVTIRPERVERFREALAATKIAPERVVVHAAYVLNVATPDAEKWTRARDGLTKELERSTSLGAGASGFGVWSFRAVNGPAGVVLAEHPREHDTGPLARELVPRTRAPSGRIDEKS